jgi:hypothetical protein
LHLCMVWVERNNAPVRQHFLESVRIAFGCSSKQAS